MKTRNRVLAFISLASLLIYVLACGPAWSPDGRKLLLPFFDPDLKQAGIWLYDCQGKDMKCIFQHGGPDLKENETALVAQWLPDGAQAVVAWANADQNSTVLLHLPLGTGRPTRMHHLAGRNGGNNDKATAAIMGLANPLLVTARYAYLGGDAVQRVDLETGEIRSKPLHFEGIYLCHAGRQMYYLGVTNETVEIGRFYPEQMNVIPILRYDDREAKREMTPFLAGAPDGERFAFASKTNKQWTLLIFRGQKQERSIPLGSEEVEVVAGNLAWSRDGKTIYAAGLAKEAGKEDRIQLSVMEIAADGKGIRNTPICHLKTKSDWEMVMYWYQIALSPDGKTIATSTMLIPAEYLKAVDRALYLVDLTTEGRSVDRVHMPKLPGSPATPDK